MVLWKVETALLTRHRVIEQCSNRSFSMIIGKDILEDQVLVQMGGKMTIIKEHASNINIGRSL
jgi:hypothetical protein